MQKGRVSGRTDIHVSREVDSHDLTLWCEVVHVCTVCTVCTYCTVQYQRIPEEEVYWYERKFSLLLIRRHRRHDRWGYTGSIPIHAQISFRIACISYDANATLMDPSSTVYCMYHANSYDGVWKRVMHFEVSYLFLLFFSGFILWFEMLRGFWLCVGFLCEVVHGVYIQWEGSTGEKGILLGASWRRFELWRAGLLLACLLGRFDRLIDGCGCHCMG